MRVALFVTCVNDAVYPGTGKAVVRVLERLGHEIVFPMSQTCCGQMHLNTGYRREAHKLARAFARTFAGDDPVVVPSASCAATVLEMYEYLARLATDSVLEDELLSLKPRVYEFTQFLVDVLGTVDVGASFPHTVGYHPTCHSLRSLKLGDGPRRLLQAVHGLQFVELADDKSCCGFGGTFALKNSQTSAAMGRDMVDAVTRAGVEFLCAADNSCLTHIGGLAARSSHGFNVVHIAEVLASTAEDPYPGAQ
jgi:L-lactate dehydrogenase complex protein LldE